MLLLFDIRSHLLHLLDPSEELLLHLVIEIVVADPIFTLDADTLDALGMLSNVTVALAEMES